MDIIFYISIAIIAITALIVAFVDFDSDDNKCGLIAISGVVLIVFLVIEAMRTYPPNREYKTSFYENKTDKPVKVLFMVKRMYMHDYVKEVIVMPMSYANVSNSKIVSEMPLIDIFDAK